MNAAAKWPPVAVGDQAPVVERHIELTDMIAYSGATWDWHRIHYDAEFYTAKGLSRPLVDGQVFGAYLTMMLQDWLGREAFVSMLEFRYASMVFAGDTIRCHGRVVELREGTVLVVELGVDVVNDGDRSVLSAARAEVRSRP